MAVRDVDPFDQTAAAREYGAELRRRDREQRPELDAAYEAGREDQANRGPAAPERRPAAARGSQRRGPATARAEALDTGAGIVLGAIAWALALAFLREGPTGPARWIAAKFWNAVPSTTTSSPSSSTTAPASTPGAAPGASAPAGAAPSGGSGGSW